MKPTPSRHRLAALACSLACGAALLLPSSARAQALGFSAQAALNSNAATDTELDFRCRVATDRAGVWIAAWSSAEPLGGTLGMDNDVLFERSLDNGATWTPAAPLNTNAAVDSGDDDFAFLAADGAGNWVVVWQSDDDLGGTIGTDIDLLAARSADDGATWSAPVSIKDNAAADPSFDGEASLATDGAGNWVVIWSSNDNRGGTINTDFDILVSRSTDNGATWTVAAPLNSNAAVDVGSDFEPSLATDGAGNWVAIWKTLDDLGGAIGSDFDLLVARSTDNGATWTAPAPLNGNAATDSGADDDPNVATDGAGNWVATWTSNENFGGMTGTEGDIVVATSSDAGATWSAPALLNGNAATDSGLDDNPVATTDGDGNWVVAWRSFDSLGGTIGADVDVLVAHSIDNGANWTAPATLNSNAAVDTNPDIYASVASDGAGNWVAIWTSGDDLGGTIGADFDILFATSNGLPVDLAGFTLE